MSDVATQQRFVQLRCEGCSFARIAEELNISKPTLIKWSRKLQYDIQNQRAIHHEALRDKWLESSTDNATSPVRTRISTFSAASAGLHAQRSLIRRGIPLAKNIGKYIGNSVVYRANHAFKIVCKQSLSVLYCIGNSIGKNDQITRQQDALRPSVGHGAVTSCCRRPSIVRSSLDAHPER